VRGVCSMARTSNPHSANSQFFICFDDATFLDNQYTVWGEGGGGMDLSTPCPRASRRANPARCQHAGRGGRGGLIRTARARVSMTGAEALRVADSTSNFPRGASPCGRRAPAMRGADAGDTAGRGAAGSVVADLPDFPAPGRRCVFNDTKVIPARAVGVRSRAGGSVAVVGHPAPPPRAACVDRLHEARQAACRRRPGPVRRTGRPRLPLWACSTPR